MKVLHVTPSYYPATYWGGPIYSTYELCNKLATTQPIDLRVLTTDSNGPKKKDRLDVEAFPTRSVAGYPIYYFNRDWSSTFSRRLFRHLPAMVRWADIVHLTAAYSAPTIPTLAICKALQKPVVWSPRGAFRRWEGTSRPLLKRAWEQMSDLLCDKSRVTLHLTSEEELSASITRIKRAAAIVIPNGITPVPGPKQNHLRNTDSLRLLYMGRLDKIKGIENLLLAIRELDPSVTLSICGNGINGYQRDLEELTLRLGVESRVCFEGLVTGDDKIRRFAASDVFVMPSHSESFGMAAAEALSFGLPVIVSKGAPWSQVEKVGCGLWVDNDPKALANAIKIIREMPLIEMGKKGQDWVSKEFSWDAIARRMFTVYKQLVDHQHHG